MADLNDVALFRDGPPHDVFARMREETPVAWNEPSHDMPGYWSVTRHDDIVATNKNWADFSSARRGISIREGGILPAEFARLVFSMMDPPDHARHRGILQKAFTHRAVAERADDIRRIANDLIDAIVEAGEGDLVRDIAEAYPLIVTSNMLGVPPADRPKLFRWTNLMADTTLASEAMLEAMGEMAEYIMGLIELRREQPSDDLLSRLMAADLDGEKLSDVELTLHFVQLMAGGNETTRNAFAGGMEALMAFGEQRRRLLDEPELMATAVEEILRWHTPVMYMARTAMLDTEIAGVPVKDGDLVVLWHVSGNRDPGANDAPDTFDVTRRRVEHTSFGGGGIHFCLGNQLARLELTIVLTELLRRIPDPEPAGPATRHPSNIFHWMTSLPVTFTPGPKTAVA